MAGAVALEKVAPPFTDTSKRTSLSELFRTEDHREGVKSFLEKRPAVYVGR